MQNEPDPDHWNAWLHDHAKQLLLYARQQTRSESDAEDVLQEALVESWRRCDGEEPPLALVYATIRRRAIDLARSHDARVRREQPEEGEAWFEPDLADRETAELLVSAVRELAEHYREVITLKIWGGLTFEQIAEATGVPMNTAASRYRYALQELRKTVPALLL